MVLSTSQYWLCIILQNQTEELMEFLRTEYCSDSSSDDDDVKSENVSERKIDKSIGDQLNENSTIQSSWILGSSDGNNTVESEIENKQVTGTATNEGVTKFEPTKETHCDKFSSNAAQKIETPKIDYFGLSNEESEYDMNELENKPKFSVKKVEKVSVEGKFVSLEIPDSKFWSDVESSQLQGIQNRVVESRRIKEHSGTIDSHEESKRKRSGPSFEQNVSSSKRDNFALKSSQELHVGSYNESRQSKIIESALTKQQSQIRKLFFIHPKIAPLLHYQRQTCRAPSKQEWKSQGHAGSVNRVKWNVSSYSHLFVTCSMDSTIKIWNIWSQLDPCVKVLSNHSKAVRDVDWSQDGKKLLSCSYDKTAAVTDVEKGCPVSILNNTCFVSCGKWQPTNGNMCVTGGQNVIQAWDMRTPAIPVRTYEYKDSFGQVQDIMFLEDGSTFFSSSDLVTRDSADRNLMAWDFSTGVTLSNQIYQERYTISRLKPHPSDGNFLAQSNGNYIAIFSGTRPYKMNRQKRFEGHKVLGYSLGFDVTPDGSTVISGSSDGKLYCYNYHSGKLFRTLHTDMDVIMDLSFHPLLPSTAACCAWDGTVHVWK